MKTKILAMCLLFSASMAASQAWAVGEVLKLDTYGKKYCANQAPVELDPTNAAPYWAKVDSATAISLYFDAGLTQKAFTLPVVATPLPDENRRGVFAVNAILGPTANGYFVINGTAKTNSTKSEYVLLRVNFIRRGLLDACSASGYLAGKIVR
jgi:hypothetical protein